MSKNRFFSVEMDVGDSIPILAFINYKNVNMQGKIHINAR